MSRGGLLVPSKQWMETVKAFELIFSLVMGPTVDSSPGIVRRLVAALHEKEPTLDQRIARRLVTTRMHIRIRWLNAGAAAAAAKRRSEKQKRQHQRSST